jgi:hypothetical protein
MAQVQRRRHENAVFTIHSLEIRLTDLAGKVAQDISA